MNNRAHVVILFSCAVMHALTVRLCPVYTESPEVPRGRIRNLRYNIVQGVASGFITGDEPVHSWITPVHAMKCGTGDHPDRGGKGEGVQSDHRRAQARAVNYISRKCEREWR
jgi:hypothetical protein